MYLTERIPKSMCLLQGRYPVQYGVILLASKPGRWSQGHLKATNETQLWLLILHLSCQDRTHLAFPILESCRLAAACGQHVQKPDKTCYLLCNGSFIMEVIAQPNRTAQAPSVAGSGRHSKLAPPHLDVSDRGGEFSGMLLVILHLRTCKYHESRGFCHSMRTLPNRVSPGLSSPLVFTCSGTSGTSNAMQCSCGMDSASFQASSTHRLLDERSCQSTFLLIVSSCIRRAAALTGEHSWSRP